MVCKLLDSLRRRIRVPCVAACTAACVAASVGVPSPAAAQMVMDGVAQLPFNRPEAWALKYFTSASLLSGLETPRTRTPGTMSLGVEFGALPSLTSAQQLVGFNGTESQDLNQAPFFLRPRITVALPARLSLLVAFVPPVKLFGITPRLLAAAIERPMHETASWTVGLRAYGQIGRVTGSYTCPKAALAFAPGSPGNEDGCEAASSDVASLRYLGGEILVARGAETPRRLSPHAALGINYMNVAFHVDALTFGMIDHTRYLSHGWTASGSAGVSYPLTSRVGLGFDLFYAPLTVIRRPDLPVQNDGLFTVRALVAYRLR